jgi:Zn-dependent M28 family amino/carboxypeptidase
MDLRDADRWLAGEAWTGSRVPHLARRLCDDIGPRWSGTDAEWRAIEFVGDELRASGLDEVHVEEFDMLSWSWSRCDVSVVDGESFDALPFIRCPTVALEAPVVDIGHGTPREIAAVAQHLPGAVALMTMAPEPFTQPAPHAYRLREAAAAGAAAAACIDPKSGQRREYHSAHDARDPAFPSPPLPSVAITRETGARLRRRDGSRLRLDVVTALETKRTANVHGVLRGADWPDEDLVLGGHHDTVFGTPGGNDNSSGIIACLETARLLAGWCRRQKTAPARTLRFVTYAAEEQAFQGSFEFVRRHYGPAVQPAARPRLAINLDELSAGHMKGLVLGFEHLRDLVQAQFDDMGDGLRCHVMAQLDNSSDHFPYLAAGLDAAHLWRWRFRGRHADADYHHEPADTADKIEVRELKEYAAQLSRLLWRLAHVPPDAWPSTTVTADEAQRRVIAERGTVVRVH